MAKRTIARALSIVAAMARSFTHHPLESNMAMMSPVPGQPGSRTDSKMKVSGAARYAADSPVRNILLAFIVQSIAAAIANAVYHAAGKRDRDLPITVDKLLT